MRILLDECVPVQIRNALPGHEIKTARQMGRGGLANGKLLGETETAGFDLIIVADKNMRHQQNLAGRKLASLELWTNHRPTLEQHLRLHPFGGGEDQIRPIRGVGSAVRQTASDRDCVPRSETNRSVWPECGGWKVSSAARRQRAAAGLRPSRAPFRRAVERTKRGQGVVWPAAEVEAQRSPQKKLARGTVGCPYNPFRARKKRERLVTAWDAMAWKRLPGLFVVSNVCHTLVVRLVLYSTVTVWPGEQRTSKLNVPGT